MLYINSSYKILKWNRMYCEYKKYCKLLCLSKVKMANLYKIGYGVIVSKYLLKLTSIKGDLNLPTFQESPIWSIGKEFILFLFVIWFSIYCTITIDLLSAYTKVHIIMISWSHHGRTYKCGGLQAKQERHFFPIGSLISFNEKSGMHTRTFFWTVPQFRTLLVA